MPELSPQRWLIYALGGGLGHFHRAIAMGRAATSRGHYIKILTNSRFANLIPWKNEIKKNTEVKIIPHSANPRETIQQIYNNLNYDDYDRLIVDTFPRGLAGELPALIEGIRKPKILVSRYIKPSYIENFNLFEEIKKYDLIFSIEQIAPFANYTNSISTDPWLICNSNELLSKIMARCRLKIDPKDNRPLIVVCGTGNHSDIDYFNSLTKKLKFEIKDWIVRLTSPIPNVGDLNAWPLLQLMQGIEVLVGAGGYNIVHESRATGTPLLALPKVRLYDNQLKRLKNSETFKSINHLIDQLPLHPSPNKSIEFKNGVVQAAKLIEGF